jgi:hypothetical protein
VPGEGQRTLETSTTRQIKLTDVSQDPGTYWGIREPVLCSWPVH